MTVQADIAAVADGGDNPPSRVRTALTSVWDAYRRSAAGEYEGVTYTPVASGLSDEFTAGTLAAKWTAVGMVSGTVNMSIDANTLTDSVYDLTSEPGSLLVQVKGNDDCGLRADQIIGDGEEVIVALGLSGNSGAGNTMWITVGFNNDDGGLFAGSGVGLGWDGPDDTRWLTLAANTLNVPQVGGVGIGGRIHYLRLYRSGAGLWAWVSADGRNWANAYSNRQSPAMTVPDNFWIYFNVGGWSNVAAPVFRVPWVRHTTFTGWAPNWS